MRYAVFNGGKRVRPLLVYATGECLGVDPALLDAPAVAIELIHAFSLVHDDLPAMDDDDLRRGKPTVHRQFDEATAILAADALQPLAFSVLADAPTPRTASAPRSFGIADACGSIGMTGGQSMDLSAEGKQLSAELEHMYALKTGALIHAAVMSAACSARILDDEPRLAHLDDFARRRRRVPDQGRHPRCRRRDGRHRQAGGLRRETRQGNVSVDCSASRRRARAATSCSTRWTRSSRFGDGRRAAALAGALHRGARN